MTPARKFASLSPIAAALGVFVFLLCGPVAGVAAADQSQAKARLAFVNGDRIFAIDADGGNRLALTTRAASLGEYDEEYDSAPRVSPDGRSFLFLREVDYDAENFRGEYTKLMVGSMDGTGARLVTNSKRLESKQKRFAPQVYLNSAGWNRDGTRILFTQTDESFRANRNGGRFSSRRLSRIRSIKPDGSGLKTVLKSRLNSKQGKGYSGRGVFTDLDVSAGNKVLVTRELRPGGRSDIHVVDMASGNSKRLVRSAEHGRWSPDGKSILFLSDRDKTGRQCEESSCYFQSKLYVADADGSGQRRVLKQKGQAGSVNGADWSPDGTRIAFGSDRNFPFFFGFASEIYSIDPDGSCLTWLTNGSPESWAPDFAPGAGLDSDPGGCGAVERDVLVDPLPPEHPSSFSGKPFSWPTLWMGPTYRGTVLMAPGGFEPWDLSYADCDSFRRSECEFNYFDLRTNEVCFAQFRDQLEDGKYLGMVSRRGALLTEPVFRSRDYRTSTLFTGGQEVEILVESYADRKPTKFAEYMNLVDALRPVGRDDLAGADLDPPVFDRASVTLAGKIDVEMDDSGSIAFVAKQFNKSRKAIRAYLRFNRDIEKVGPVRLKSCRD